MVVFARPTPVHKRLRDIQHSHSCSDPAGRDSAGGAPALTTENPYYTYTEGSHQSLLRIVVKNDAAVFLREELLFFLCFISISKCTRLQIISFFVKWDTQTPSYKCAMPLHLSVLCPLLQVCYAPAFKCATPLHLSVLCPCI